MNGRYILPPEIFSILEKTEYSQGELQITDAINTYCQTHTFLACDKVGKRYDIGSKTAYLKALLDFAVDSDMKEEIITHMKSLLENQTITHV